MPWRICTSPTAAYDPSDRQRAHRASSTSDDTTPDDTTNDAAADVIADHGGHEHGHRLGGRRRGRLPVVRLNMLPCLGRSSSRSSHHTSPSASEALPWLQVSPMAYTSSAEMRTTATATPSTSTGRAVPGTRSASRADDCRFGGHRPTTSASRSSRDPREQLQQRPWRASSPARSPEAQASTSSKNPSTTSRSAACGGTPRLSRSKRCSASIGPTVEAWLHFTSFVSISRLGTLLSQALGQGQVAVGLERLRPPWPGCGS